MVSGRPMRWEELWKVWPLLGVAAIAALALWLPGPVRQIRDVPGAVRFRRRSPPLTTGPLEPRAQLLDLLGCADIVVELAAMGHLAFGRLGAASAVVHQCLRQRLRSLQQQRASRSEDIFFFGGRGFSGLALDVAARFSPGEEEWQALPPLPTARWAAAAAALGQELLVMGGYSDGADTDVVHCFDPFRSSWRSPSNLKLSCPRSESAAVGLEGRVYLVAGTSFGQELDLLERCDGGGWEPLAPLPSPRSGCCAAACGAKLFVVGGFAGGYTLRRAECLDAEWRLLPPAMTARWHLRLRRAAGSVSSPRKASLMMFSYLSRVAPCKGQLWPSPNQQF
ncbi:unnamed protein product [Effrenium voratum]|nr:unnamed protein product [Effrenium voratum]